MKPTFLTYTLLEASREINTMHEALIRSFRWEALLVIVFVAAVTFSFTAAVAVVSAADGRARERAEADRAAQNLLARLRDAPYEEVSRNFQEAFGTAGYPFAVPGLGVPPGLSEAGTVWLWQLPDHDGISVRICVMWESRWGIERITISGELSAR